METILKWFIGFCLASFALIFIFILIQNQESKQRANSYKLENCIKYVNEIVPDPNDTETRSKYLQECYEN